MNSSRYISNDEALIEMHIVAHGRRKLGAKISYTNMNPQRGVPRSQEFAAWRAAKRDLGRHSKVWVLKVDLSSVLILCAARAEERLRVTTELRARVKCGHLT